MSGVGRPVLKRGRSGNISVKQLPSGKWRATAWYRDESSGARRQMTRTERTKSDAVDSLKGAIESQAAGRATGRITPDTTITELVAVNVSSLPSRGHATQTGPRYAAAAKNTIVPNIGQLRLSEINRGDVTRLIKKVAETSPSEAKQVRTVLKQMLELAVDDRAIEHNWAARTGVVIHDPNRPEPRGLSMDELDQVFALIRADRDKLRSGPKSTKAHDDLLDILLIQLGAAGLRISEAAAIGANDMTIDDAGTVHLRVHQAVVYQSPANGASGRYIVQPNTKTKKKRVIALPPFAADLLARRTQTAGSDGLLFHSATGGPLNLNNVRRTLRTALDGTEFADWTSTHTMRRTVATLVFSDPNHDTEDAMKVLGHNQRATTERYIERSELAPDVTALTTRFGDLA